MSAAIVFDNFHVQLPPQQEALLLLTADIMDTMALVFTLVQKDCTEQPGNTAQ